VAFNVPKYAMKHLSPGMTEMATINRASVNTQSSDSVNNSKVLTVYIEFYIINNALEGEYLWSTCSAIHCALYCTMDTSSDEHRFSIINY
jgi:hypothetical protein